MLHKLGIIAGRGTLPRLLIEASQRAGRDVFVLALKDQCDPQTVLDVDHAWVRLGGAGTSIRLLHQHDVKDLVMAGAVTRPNLWAIWPDMRTLRFLMGGFFSKGDDGLLRAIITTLEHDEGFHFVGVYDILPDLLTPEGVLGSVQPTDAHKKDIKASQKAALNLGAHDIGQAAVALHGLTVALEDQDGTDAMLMHLATSGAGRGGVLAKMCKPGQERRADLPTIGVKTVENAHQAGLKGIVVEAGASVIVNRDDVIRAADDAGLFVVGVKK